MVSHHHMAIFPAAALLLAYSNLLAAGNCAPNLTGYDVCKVAREVADMLAKQFPMRVSQNMVLEKAIAIETTVAVTALLSYDQRTLSATAKAANLTDKNLADRMKDSTKAGLCQKDSPSRALIDLGGIFQYTYRFSDGQPYLIIKVHKCDSP